jgi:hypothetical protein
MKMRLAAFGLAGGLVFALPATARAQATGTISGAVTDESEGALPEATVDATNQGTNQVRTATSGADGLYTIPLLPPGLYRVKATLTGFTAFTRERVRVTVSETALVNLTLKVGQVSESVTIVGEPPLIETANATHRARRRGGLPG